MSAQPSLDDFEALVERIERCLADDQWDPADWEGADLPVGPFPPEDLHRARALVARAVLCQERLQAELRETRTALGDVSLRRTAASRYSAGGRQP